MLIEEKADDYIKDEDDLGLEKAEDEEKVEPKKSNRIFDILKSPTGKGSISDYNEHPLNYTNNKYISQILRGLSGILGNLDLAIIDISLGLLGLFKNKNNAPLASEKDV